MKQLLTVSFTRLQLEEICHKLRIVTEEPDLQESYKLTEAQAEEVFAIFYAALPGRVEFPALFRDVIKGELEDRCNALLSNWKDCGDEDEGALYRSLKIAIRKVIEA